MNKLPFIILNGEIGEFSKLNLSPFNRGLMYGDGCFETLKSYKGKFLGWELHFDRLCKGLEYLGIENELTSDTLKKSVIWLLNENELLQKNAVIRIQCWRDGGRGYTADENGMNWMISAGDFQSTKTSKTVITAKTRCIPSVALDRRFKLSNSLNFIKAAQEAKEKQADDALMLTIDNHISELTSANIFWIHGETVFTPSEDCDILPGITRKIVMDLMAKNLMKMETGKFSLQHLYQAEAAFCCNSVAEIQKTESVDDVVFETAHPLVKKIMEAFEQYKLESLTA